MQGYEKIVMTKDDIVPTAQRMRDEGRQLVMIHGFLTDNGFNVSYEYEVGSNVASYTVETAESLPSIAAIYDKAAEWPERELHELMGITFEGLDTSRRLFLADSMLDGQGQILVTHMKELIDKAQGGKQA